MATDTVSPIPEGYQAITPYIVFKDSQKAIDFYKRAFGAVEVYRMAGPDGKGIAHAELKIGDARFMLSDEMGNQAQQTKSAESSKGSPIGFYLYVTDVDQQFKAAIDAGAQSKNAVGDMFWGDRCGTIIDPFGLHWTVATHREELSYAEIEKRGKEFFAQKKAA